jgi:hypothetical protein
MSEPYCEYDHGFDEPCGCGRPARPSARWGMIREIAPLAGWKNAEGACGRGRGPRRSRPGNPVGETVSQY